MSSFPQSHFCFVQIPTIKYPCSVQLFLFCTNIIDLVVQVQKRAEAEQRLREESDIGEMKTKVGWNAPTHLHHCHHGGHNLLHPLTIKSWKTSHQKYWMPQIENWYYSGGKWPSPSVEGGFLKLFFTYYCFHFPDNDFLMVFTFGIIIVKCFHFPDNNCLMFSLGRGEPDWASGGRVPKSRPDYQG